MDDDDELVFVSPLTKREARREAKLRRVQRFLDGEDGDRTSHDGPRHEPKSPVLRVPIDVGERVDPSRPRDPRGPGINVIERREDDHSVVRTGWGTLLTPGEKR